MNNKMNNKKLTNKTMDEKIFEFSSIIVGFAIGTFILVLSIILYLKTDISYLVLRAITFLYVLCIFLLLIRLYFIEKIKKFGESIGFQLTTPFYLQPKLEGHYKGNWWQIHYVSKEAGKNPSILRTYIKLQWKVIKEFDTPKLDKYDDSKYKGHDILTIKHIVRPYKNYLLLKRKGFTFNKLKIYELMDLLLRVAKESEVKKKTK
jgi:hypothetical protein